MGVFDHEVRVPMRSPASFVGPNEIAASLMAKPDMKMGRRFSIDVAEEAFAKMSGALIEHIASDLAKQAVWRNENEIRSAIASYIHDRQWAEPVVREAFKESVKEFIVDFMKDAADRRQAFRDLIDLLSWGGMGDLPSDP